jgi:hypothetical protein
MADTKISAMPDAGALTGAEFVPLIQSGANVKATLDDVLAYDRAYGAWSDSTDQAGSISAGTAITFNTQDVSDGITLSGSSQFVVPNNGIYNLQFSAQLKNIDNAQHDANIWFRVDGVDLANSNTQLTVPARKSAGVFGYAVAAWNIFLDLNAGQYVQLMWLPTSLNVSLEHLPASVTPAYPATPSVILSIQQVA